MKRIRQNGLWGAVNSAGNLMVPFRYEEFEKFHYGTAWVKEQGKWGMLDKTGAAVLPCEYDEKRNIVAEKYYWVRKNGKWGMVLRPNLFVSKHAEVFPCEYEETGKFFGTCVQVKTDKWGLRNMDGKTVIPCLYDEIRYWNGPGYPVRQGDKWGVAGRGFVLPCEYDFVGNYCCRRFRVKKDGKWGYGDENARLFIPAVYDYVLDFRRPWRLRGAVYAKVKRNGYWGVIDQAGHTVVPCTYDRIDFSGRIDDENAGLISACRDGKWKTGYASDF